MFDSCSAYQSPRSVLFLSHCVPDPPDKGEKIRAHHLLNHLARNHRVHLVCFARSEQEVEDASKLRDRCASVFVRRLRMMPALAKASLQFATGRCLTASFYGSSSMRTRVRELAGQVDCTIAFSTAMVQYAPEEVPLIVDMVDVDSEKFVQYSRRRRPRFLYGIEARRLRLIERSAGSRSSAVLLTTATERRLFQTLVGGDNVRVMENGIDLDYFHPGADVPAGEMYGRDYAVFTGVMNYPPNAEGAAWFARHVLPEIRRRRTQFEFVIVGRNPPGDVRALGRLPGVVVTGTVPDVRPYLANARVAVAPLLLARGIQNKVLEALAMGKPVLASPAVMKTFDSNPPLGLRGCDSPADYVRELEKGAGHSETSIHTDVAGRFRWSEKLKVIDNELERILGTPLAAFR